MSQDRRYNRSSYALAYRISGDGGLSVWRRLHVVYTSGKMVGVFDKSLPAAASDNIALA